MINELSWRNQNDNINTGVLKRIREMFPIESSSKKLVLKDLNYESVDPKDFPKQKQIKLKGQTLDYAIYADLELIDKKTNKVLDKINKFKIAKVPLFHPRLGTLIKGLDYQVDLQFRLKSGIYSRKKQNGEIEAQVNLQKGGKGFLISLDPEKEIFTISVSKRNFKLFPILKALGVDEERLKMFWGPSIYLANMNAARNVMERQLIEFMRTVREKDPAVDYKDALVKLKEFFRGTELNEDTTKLTLGKGFRSFDSEAILHTTKRLIGILRDGDEPDDRDSPRFKSVTTPADNVLQRVDNMYPRIKRSLERILNSPNKTEIRKILTSDNLSEPIVSFFTNTELASPTSQTNPLLVLKDAKNTTVMGPGGIKSDHQLTRDLRNVDNTSIGILDPLATPEGGKIGVNVGLAMGVFKEGDNLNFPVINAKTGTKELLDHSKIYDLKIGFSDDMVKKNNNPVIKNGRVQTIRKDVNVVYQGKNVNVPASQVDYFVSDNSMLFSMQSNMVPFLQTVQGNRGATSGKMMTQAVALKEREAPLVQSQFATNKNKTVENILGDLFIPRSPVDGTVAKVTDDYIYVKDDKTKKINKIGLYNNFPLNEESFYHSTPTVKVGDKVTKNKPVAIDNFSAIDKNNNNKVTSALGTNLNVAFLPFKGEAFEDGIVITESAAKATTSEHMYHEKFTIDLSEVRPGVPRGILDLKKFRGFYPQKINDSVASKYDERGIIKKGQKINPGEILIAYLHQNELTGMANIINKLDKAIIKPYSDKSLVWEHDHEGTIVDVNVAGKNIHITIKTEEKTVVGDKIVGRAGNKGIITRIIPDEEAPHTSDGKRADIIINPTTVPGRININQVLELTASKIAEKTGKPYIAKSFNNEDWAKKILADAKKHGIPVTEKMTDGKNGKAFENEIGFGKMYILKLKHTVAHKMSARSRGAYDQNATPMKDANSAQSIDGLSYYSLLSHGAKKNLKEMSSIKSDKNDEYWFALQTNQAVPPPKIPFTFEKFRHMLSASGVNLTQEGTKFKLLPMTDKDVVKMSNGEVKDGGKLLIGKNLKSEKDGLFDFKVFGGTQGNKYGHINLAKKIPNPMMEPSIIALLGIKDSEFKKLIENETVEGIEGLKGLEEKLNSINLDTELKKVKAELDKTFNVNDLDKVSKKYRILLNLKKLGLKPKDLLLSKVPVIPPVYRPIMQLGSGDIMANDLNYLYKDLAIINKKTGDSDIPDNLKKDLHKDLYKSFKAIAGLADPPMKASAARGHNGVIRLLGAAPGKSPKKGFVQKSMLARRQDLSARSTITVDSKLNVDQVGIPLKIAKTIFEPFVMKSLTGSGKTPLQAKEEIENWTPVAQKHLETVMKNRKVWMNRAPSLHRFSFVPQEPVLTTGSDIKMNPLVMPGLNADLDGDTLSVHVPISDEAVKEMEEFMPSKNPFGTASQDLLIGLEKEYALGIFLMTKFGKRSNKRYTDMNSMKKDNELGKIYKNTVINYKGKLTTLGRELVKEVLPEKYHKRIDKAGGKGVDKKEINNIIGELFANKNPKAKDILDKLKNLGFQYSHDFGFSLSLNDYVVDRTGRDKIVQKYEKLTKGKKDEDKIKLWMQATKEVEKHEQDKFYGTDNNLYILKESKVVAGAKGGNVTQGTMMPGVISDVYGKPIVEPIKKSYGEGLSAAEYWATMPGVRRGSVDKALSTKDAGAMNKEVVKSMFDMAITEDDCGTYKGTIFPLTTEQVRINGRYFIKAIPRLGITRDDYINNETFKKLKKAKITEVELRSPIHCLAKSGVCRKCTGAVDETNGQPYRIGTNIGVRFGQTISELYTQSALSSFHDGGRVTSTGKVTDKRTRTEELLRNPSITIDRATLAEVSGTVTNIVVTSTGGKNVIIGGKKHFIAPNLNVTVKVGDIVKKGDQISEGNAHASDIARLKSIYDTRQNFVTEMEDMIGKGKYNPKIYEVVAKQLFNYGQVMNNTKDSKFIKGDILPISEIDYKNRTPIMKDTSKAVGMRLAESLPGLRKGHRLTEHDIKSIGKSKIKVYTDGIKYRPVVKYTPQIPTFNKDWFGNLTASNMKKTLINAANLGNESDIHGNNPFLSYTMGKEHKIKNQLEQPDIDTPPIRIKSHY